MHLPGDPQPLLFDLQPGVPFVVPADLFGLQPRLLPDLEPGPDAVAEGDHRDQQDQVLRPLEAEQPGDRFLGQPVHRGHHQHGAGRQDRQPQPALLGGRVHGAGDRHRDADRRIADRVVGDQHEHGGDQHAGRPAPPDQHQRTENNRKQVGDSVWFQGLGLDLGRIARRDRDRHQDRQHDVEQRPAARVRMALRVRRSDSATPSAYEAAAQADIRQPDVSPARGGYVEHRSEVKTIDGRRRRAIPTVRERRRSARTAPAGRPCEDPVTQ